MFLLVLCHFFHSNNHCLLLVFCCCVGSHVPFFKWVCPIFHFLPLSLSFSKVIPSASSPQTVYSSCFFVCFFLFYCRHVPKVPGVPRNGWTAQHTNNLARPHSFISLF